jgi:putative hemolysin
LRFDVFNLELGEGLVESYSTGRDEDVFDSVCDHLVVVDDASGQVIGTYRLQTGDTAARHHGFYSAREFDLDRIPPDVLRRSVELGRACVAREHRNTRVLLSLWRGIVAYAAARRTQYLFGCCSLPGTDAASALLANRLFLDSDLVHDRFVVEPRAEYVCPTQGTYATCASVEISPLFGMYLRYGARVCGGPALDREFGTTDFFVLLELDRLDARSIAMLYADARV